MDKKRILIIDDEKDFTDLIKSTLEETSKYEVKTENDGIKGFNAARAFKPDLILLDVIMPGMEGSYVAAEIRKDERLKNIPIVFVTATVTLEETEKANGVIGGYQFLPKPLHIKQLFECIEDCMQKD